MREKATTTTTGKKKKEILFCFLPSYFFILSFASIDQQLFLAFRERKKERPDIYNVCKSLVCVCVCAEETKQTTALFNCHGRAVELERPFGFLSLSRPFAFKGKRERENKKNKNKDAWRFIKSPLMCLSFHSLSLTG